MLPAQRIGQDGLSTQSNRVQSSRIDETNFLQKHTDSLIGGGGVEGARGSVVLKALCYKPEVAGLIPDEIVFFLIYVIIPAALGPAEVRGSIPDDSSAMR
jgi:hypothetical protein